MINDRTQHFSITKNVYWIEKWKLELSIHNVKNLIVNKKFKWILGNYKHTCTCIILNRSKYVNKK